jgi:hypothetical protein
LSVVIIGTDFTDLTDLAVFSAFSVHIILVLKVSKGFLKESLTNSCAARWEIICGLEINSFDLRFLKSLILL